MNKVLIFTGLIALSACRNSEEDLRPFLNRQELLAEKGKDVEINYTDSGITRILLKAPEMTRRNFNGLYVTEMRKGLNAFMYDESGKQTSTLRGDYGRRDEGTEEMQVKGNVRVTNDRGDTLLTDNITLYEKSDLLKTGGPVTVKTKTEVIQAMGLESNRAFTRYKFTKVTGRFSVKKPN